MNDQTIQMIKDLATKLGTTAEHLWAVLVRQAPISSAMDTLVMIACGVGIYFCAIGFKKALTDIEESDNEAPHLAMICICGVMGVLSLIGFGLCISCLSDIAAGFFNPEYWALKQIIK